MNKQEWVELLKTDLKKFNKTREIEIDLRQADLGHADLRDADLRQADLGHADLRDADLRDADLGGANLRGAYLGHADLRQADLRHANLGHANLRGADLRDADLGHADLDYSCFPLWCGSFDMKTDMRLVYQLCYHICRMEIKNKNGDQSKTGRMIQKFLMPYANKFHRVDECGEIEYSEK